MRRDGFRGRLLPCLTLAALLAAAPLAAAPIRPIRFDRLSLEQGLSQSTVWDIFQDRTGYVWLATEDGLNRFDGASVKVYRHDPSDAASLPGSFVYDIKEDAAGNLWLATINGLAMWERATDRILRHEKLATRPVRALELTRDNALWLGTRDSGLLRLDLASGQLTSFVNEPARAESLSNDRIYALHADKAGRLWIGTDGGLDLLDASGKGFVHFVPRPGDPKSLSDAGVRTIAEDDAGALWVGTAKGLNRLDPKSRSFERFLHDANVPSSLAHDYVGAVLLDSDGRLWVGTQKGLDLFDADRRSFAHYRNDPTDPASLAHDYVMSLAQDRGGVIWVGTRLGGAHKWRPLSWQFGHVAADVQSPTGLGSPRVTSFSEDRSGRLFIGTFDGGLYAMDRSTGEMTRYRKDPKNPRSLGSDQVMALQHDQRSGDLWIGTRDAGLDRFNTANGSFKHYRSDPKNPDSLSANGVTSILQDRDGRVWLGTYGGGLERLDPESERFTHYRHDPKDDTSLSADRVSSLAESGSGGLWVATMERGLNLLDRRSGKFQRFRHRPSDPASLPEDSLLTLYVDPAGTLWVGSHRGLSQLSADGRSFKTYSTKNGLSSDVVYGIRGDRQGRLWLSTTNGLSCFDPRSGVFTNYGVSDGLQAAEFNFGAWYQSPSGEMFFGGINGFNAFMPDRLRQSNVAPPVVLTSVSVGHRPIAGPADQAKQIRLGYRDNVLSFDFAALDFTAPQRNRFAYKLENFDAEWVPLSGRRGVTYTNLRAGSYTFRLRAANSDGRWNEEGLSVGVHVAAAPWATGWAYSGYGLTGIAFVFGLVRMQRRKFEREAEYARTLERRVQERTHELSERQVELERVNQELAQASITDSLTGLNNRRFVTEYLEKEVALLHRRYRRVGEGAIHPELLDMAFVMVDLDHFKTINDSAGHAAGDAVLRQLKDLLKAACRTSDIIVRWGGDEFLIVARDLNSEGLAELAERIRTRVGQHVFEVGEERVVRTTCSIGFACYPFFREQLDALSWEQVISVADRALYVSKENGRNAWVGFHPGITALPIQGLLGAICHETERLVREGTLRVSSCLLGVRKLTWGEPPADSANAAAVNGRD
jgi:diguanylate cyclase (GGDEF)-like protein